MTFENFHSCVSQQKMWSVCQNQNLIQPCYYYLEQCHSADEQGSDPCVHVYK